MAAKQTAAIENDVSHEAAETPAKTAPVFTIEKLRKYCFEIFGISPSTFDGATYGQSGEFTVDQMKDIIATWLKKEVKI